MTVSSASRDADTRQRGLPAPVASLLARRDSPALVPGTLVVAFLFAFSRWGSYLGLPSHSIFLTDLLLIGSLGWTVARYRHSVTLDRTTAWRLGPLLLLGSWAVLRSLTGPYDAEAVRDLAPYGYLLVMGVAAVVPVQAAAWRRSLRVLALASLVHLTWLTASAVLGDTLVLRMPLLGGVIRVFEVRPDYDGAVVAVLVGCALLQASVVACQGRLQASAGYLVLALGATAVVLLLANRAGLLAVVAAYVVVAAVLAPRLVQLCRAHPRATVVAVVVLVAAAVVVVPQTPIYQRLTGTGRFVQGTPGGTADARLQAWGKVLQYVDDRPSRVAIGVGTGPDYLKASGASVHYQAVGSKLVRQPHNFALNTYARLGLPGALLLGWLIVTLSAVSWRTVRSRGSGVDDVGLVLVWVAMLVTAMLGVVLEAPFGAIPFGWAAGRLLMRGAERRAVPAGVRGA